MNELDPQVIALLQEIKAIAALRLPTDRNRTVDEKITSVRGIAEDDRLPAAERKIRHRVLVAHAARQAQHIRQSVVGGGVGIHARAAARRTQCGRMNGDDGLEAGRLVVEERDLFVVIEIRRIENVHGAGRLQVTARTIRPGL